VENIDTDLVTGDLPLSSSVILDVNGTSENHDAALLSELAEGSVQVAAAKAAPSSQIREKVVNVASATKLMSDYEDGHFFTAAFPTVFPYGTGKHLHLRRGEPLGIRSWVSLLLQHSSRY
jgi:hypothetical protein